MTNPQSLRQRAQAGDPQAIAALMNRSFQQRGIQATEVYSLDPPESAGAPQLADIDDIDFETLRDVALEPARVKWFDKGKGFGFANTFGRGEDVFIHVEVLRRSGMADLQSGEALAIRVIDGKRGRMATEVCGWESAVRDED